MDYATQIEREISYKKEIEMTPNKVIETVDTLYPNSYSEERKFGWINELDGMVKRLVIQEDEAVPYIYPDDMDRELLIPAPFDNLYALYIQSMIEFHNREYGNYNNTTLMFETRFTEYKKSYIREHRARR